MPAITNLPESDRADLIARLKRVEGQAKGVQRMIEEGRECSEVVNQVSAIRAAVTAISGELLESVALRCLKHPGDFDSPEHAVEEAVRLLVRSSH